MAAQNKTFQFKLVLLGDSAVGKSSLVLRFVRGQFFDYQESTIGGPYPLAVPCCAALGPQAARGGASPGLRHFSPVARVARPTGSCDTRDVTRVTTYYQMKHVSPCLFSL